MEKSEEIETIRKRVVTYLREMGAMEDQKLIPICFKVMILRETLELAALDPQESI